MRLSQHTERVYPPPPNERVLVKRQVWWHKSVRWWERSASSTEAEEEQQHINNSSDVGARLTASGVVSAGSRVGGTGGARLPRPVKLVVVRLRPAAEVVLKVTVEDSWHWKQDGKQHQHCFAFLSPTTNQGTVYNLTSIPSRICRNKGKQSHGTIYNTYDATKIKKNGS